MRKTVPGIPLGMPVPFAELTCEEVRELASSSALTAAQALKALAHCSSCQECAKNSKLLAEARRVVSR